MDIRKNTFVFVVCGTREHVETLHFSLAALRHFSKAGIVIVTDQSRNETEVVHDNIINIQTPVHFNHHQASIYLKTGLHKFLPKGNLYCYLDTDVIACSNEVDTIFSQKNSVITFAPDHCLMPLFSPNAVHCDCIEQNTKHIHQLNELREKFDSNTQVTDPTQVEKQKELQKKLVFIKRNRAGYLLTAFRFMLSPKAFKLDHDTFYHKKDRYWFDSQGKPILYDIGDQVIKQIEKNSDLRWSYLKYRWLGPRGEDIYQLTCNHLKEYIASKFSITVKDENWQHWNGGVFLFDDASHPFLEAWHQKTLDIFTDPKWKTRDQGTLIATAWQFGLQGAPLLSKKYNFIADITSTRLMLDKPNNQITDDAFLTRHTPAFIHIYHSFGQKGWDVWDWVSSKLPAKVQSLIN